VAELMRLLVDEYQIEWEKAWQVTPGTFGYTNHTLLFGSLDQGVLRRNLENPSSPC
jgi:starch phosphorylase